MTWFFAQQLFDGIQIHKNVSMQVVDGLISDIKTEMSSDENQVDINLSGLVVPGFIDTQVNGGGGALFNQSARPETLATMVKAHTPFGTTAMMPTLISDSLAVMQQAADAMSEALSKDQQGILGLHFEGPHLGLAKRGIHPAEQIRQLSDKEMALFTRKDIGKVLVTLAPETVSPDVIAELVNQDVIVSLGHSNADIDCVLAAIEAGAKGVTHLFNAMSGLQARVPGLIGAALMDKRLTAGLIVDLHHVHAANCKLAFSAMGDKRLMLVSDSMAHVGAELDSLPWQDSVITKRNGKLTLPDGTIAGSCLDMVTAVQNCVHKLGVPAEMALRAASTIPAQFLGHSLLGTLATHKQADFNVLDETLSIKSVWRKGACAFNSVL